MDEVEEREEEMVVKMEREERFMDQCAAVMRDRRNTETRKPCHRHTQTDIGTDRHTDRWHICL